MIDQAMRGSVRNFTVREFVTELRPNVSTNRFSATRLKDVS